VFFFYGERPSFTPVSLGIFVLIKTVHFIFISDAPGTFCPSVYIDRAASGFGFLSMYFIHFCWQTLNIVWVFVISRHTLMYSYVSDLSESPYSIQFGYLNN
jgi:hypothetical protein